MPRICLRAVSLVLAAVASAPAAAQRPLPVAMNIDAGHSEVSFSVPFVGLSRVRGTFATWGGTVMYVDDDLTRSSVSVVIDASSITTNNQTRDRHLRTPDFLDVERFPRITFRSTSIARTRSGWVMRGPLTLHGVTRTVAIPFVRDNRPTRDVWGNQRTTFHGSVTISRRDYGILGTAFWSNEFDPGRVAVGDRVTIDLLVSATVPTVERWRQRQADSLLAVADSQGISAVIAGLRNPRNRERVDSIPDQAFVTAGMKLAARGRMADAVAWYEAAARLRPRSDGVRLGLAEAYLKQNRRAEALAIFEALAREDADNTRAAEWVRVLRPPGGTGPPRGA
ncbi:MAG TPA: YceI family protein [Longimicrobium sp.]